MKKSVALDLLGGSVKSAADRVQVTETAIRMWPDPLPNRIRDRVQAALYREEHPELDAEASVGGALAHGGNVGVQVAAGNPNRVAAIV